MKIKIDACFGHVSLLYKSISFCDDVPTTTDPVYNRFCFLVFAYSMFASGAPQTNRRSDAAKNRVKFACMSCTHSKVAVRNKLLELYGYLTGQSPLVFTAIRRDWKMSKMRTKRQGLCLQRQQSIESLSRAYHRICGASERTGCREFFSQFLSVVENE